MKCLVHGAINALVVACAFRRPIRFLSGFVDGMASPNGGKKDLKTSNFACRKKRNSGGPLKSWKIFFILDVI